MVDEEAVLTKYNRDTEEYYYELGTLDECLDEESMQKVIEFTFSNAKTLYGESMDKTFQVRVRHKDLGLWQLGFEEKDDNSIQWTRHPEIIDTLFTTGTKLGGALIKDPITGYLSLEFRLFEVHDNIIYLQNYSSELEAALANDDHCIFSGFKSMMLSSDYDRISLSDFREEIESNSPNIESLRQTNKTLDDFLKIRFDEAEDKGDLSYYQYLPRCAAYELTPHDELE